MAEVGTWIEWAFSEKALTTETVNEAYEKCKDIIAKHLPVTGGATQNAMQPDTIDTVLCSRCSTAVSDGSVSAIPAVGERRVNCNDVNRGHQPGSLPSEEAGTETGVGQTAAASVTEQEIARKKDGVRHGDVEE